MQEYLLSTIYYLLSTICGSRFCGGRRRSGFTLVEMLTVVVIVALLASAMGISARRAREHSRRVKAEAECRELVNSLIQYHDFYHKWPGDMQGEKEATKTILAPLLDATENDKGIVFLNVAIQGEKWNDPWGRPYHIFFPEAAAAPVNKTALETCVSFPFRKTAF